MFRESGSIYLLTPEKREVFIFKYICDDKNPDEDGEIIVRAIKENVETLLLLSSKKDRRHTISTTIGEIKYEVEIELREIIK